MYIRVDFENSVTFKSQLVEFKCDVVNAYFYGNYHVHLVVKFEGENECGQPWKSEDGCEIVVDEGINEL